MTFFADGLRMGVGTAAGNVLIYDVRAGTPVKYRRRIGGG